MKMCSAEDERDGQEQSSSPNANSEGHDAKLSKYLRGSGAQLDELKDKKLKGQLTVREKLYGLSAKAAASTEKWLMPSEGGFLETDGLEKSWRIKQESLTREVGILSARNQFDIVLPDLGPYTLDFTSSGKYMIAAGRKGHLAVMDMINMSLMKEMQVKETVRDVCFMHNELFFAAAQKKYPYIYDRDGVEVHCLKEHGAVNRLQFLKNHFLLATVNKSGQLRYQDVTSGEMINCFRTGLGRCEELKVNPFNGVTSVGHSGGTVSMWKPTSAAPLVKILCHPGPVTAIAFHPNGTLMATAGKEKKIKIWDLRKFQALQTLSGNATTMDFSQRGLLSFSSSSYIHVLGDLSSEKTYTRYMSHSLPKGYQTKTLKFRPYEDVLCMGHSMGWSSVLVPGSGEPNFDTWLANPYETGKQRREKEIHSLLDKLPPETIMLDPSKIGGIRVGKKREKVTRTEVEEAVEKAKEVRFRRKTKGRSKTSKIVKKKRELVEKVRRPFMEKLKEEEDKVARKMMKVQGDDGLPYALKRFAKANN